jgi:hypothetical protein
MLLEITFSTKSGMFDAHVHILESPETLDKVKELREDIQLIIMSTKREEW